MAALVGALFGLAIAIPALRVRGVNLAVVTLAAAVAIEELVFKNPKLAAARPARRRRRRRDRRQGLRARQHGSGCSASATATSRRTCGSACCASSSWSSWRSSWSTCGAPAPAGASSPCGATSGRRRRPASSVPGTKMLGLRPVGVHRRPRRVARPATASAPSRRLYFGALELARCSWPSPTSAASPGSLARSSAGSLVADRRDVHRARAVGPAGPRRVHPPHRRRRPHLQRHRQPRGPRRQRSPGRQAGRATSVGAGEPPPGADGRVRRAVGPREAADVAAHHHRDVRDVRRPAGRRRGRPRRRAGPARRPDRAERRRQDDVHRRHHRLRPDDRADPLRRAGDLGRCPPTGAPAGLGRTWQSLELFDDLTVRENLQVAAERQRVGRLPRSTSSDPRRPRDRSGVDYALDVLDLSRPRRPAAATSCPTVSASWSAWPGRWPLGPKLVCMDEPAAGLDTAESQALGGQLREHPRRRHHDLPRRPRHGPRARRVRLHLRARVRRRHRRRAHRPRSAPTPR